MSSLQGVMSGLYLAHSGNDTKRSVRVKATESIEKAARFSEELIRDNY